MRTTDKTKTVLTPSPKHVAYASVVLAGAAYIWNWMPLLIPLFILGFPLIFARWYFQHKGQQQQAREQQMSPEQRQRQREQKHIEDIGKTANSLRSLGAIFVIVGLGFNILPDTPSMSIWMQGFFVLLGGLLIVLAMRKEHKVTAHNDRNTSDFVVDGKGRARKMKP